jgi:mRNA interferase MazF
VARPLKGDVVVVPFPFSDQTTTKRRPAIVLVDPPGDDYVCAAISASSGDPNGIPIESHDFSSGGLNRRSVVRPTMLFTFQKDLILYTAGTVTQGKRTEIADKICELMRK